jgi:hypothetical protein
MITYQYSQEYYPPAPILEVSFIMAAQSLRVGPVLALVDSGADGTIVPIRYLEEIRAPSTTEMTIGVTGENDILSCYIWLISK